MRSITREFKSDTHKADYYLGQSHPFSWVWIFLAVTAGILLIPSSQAALKKNVSCPMPMSKVSYSASFQWIQPGTGKPQSHKLVVGAQGSSGELSAQIWTGNQCEAICQPQSFDQDGPMSPIAMQMNCRGARLGSFTTTATLLWGRGQTMSRTPTLRFGTWLNGYEQAPLLVEVDQFSLPGDGRLRGSR